ncbi:hypothetical protein BH10PLA1_BH10PLA1_06760 [soil metagenome]
MRRLFQLILLSLIAGTGACAAPAHAAEPATQPAAPALGHFPGVTVDVKKKQVRVDCESLNVDIRLEFFCVLNGTNEHESILRTAAKPSDVHAALLMCGLTPGEPVKYSDATQKWLPPHGPPLHITCEYLKDGKTVSIPAYRMMRDAETKKTPSAFTWIFAGSRVMDDGKYAADTTGYMVSVVNFDLTMIDVPNLASNANETLEWEYNPDTVPKTGTKVTMIIEPAGQDVAVNADGPAKPEAATPEPAVLKLQSDGTMTLNDQPVAATDLGAAVNKLPDGVVVRIAQAKPADEKTLGEVTSILQAIGRKSEVIAASTPATSSSDEPPISDVQLDEKKMAELKARWEKAVRPNAEALRIAAQAHYEVMAQMRREQQRLINEADRIQRAMDELEKDYQDMTTPRPEK